MRKGCRLIAAQGRKRNAGGGMKRLWRKGAARVLVLLPVLGTALLAGPHARSQEGERVPLWNVPAIDQLADDDFGRLARYGRSIVAESAAHIGPQAHDPAFRYAGNHLACASCHLRNGLKKFALPLVAASADYPAYSTRSGAEIDLAQRLNNCMVRSMNGQPMPLEARPMQALLAYLKVLSTNIPADGRISGGGAGRMAELNRPADPLAGEKIYAERCVQCHARNGEGVKRNPTDMMFGYQIPPLWGQDSFNTGAGMNRLITAANFIHNNMPAGTDWLHPTLGVEESWDVAAFVLSRERPVLAGTERDFPDLLQKPVDTPYGPYADSFPREQHVYGPFTPIREEIARLARERGTVPNPNVK